MDGHGILVWGGCLERNTNSSGKLPQLGEGIRFLFHMHVKKTRMKHPSDTRTGLGDATRIIFSLPNFLKFEWC